MSKCWKIVSGNVSTNGDDGVHSNGPETAIVGTHNQRTANIDCYNGRKKGHYVRDCPDNTKGKYLGGGAMRC